MESTHKPMRSGMALSDATHVGVLGMDPMYDVVGKVNRGYFTLLEIQRRLPTFPQSFVFNAKLAALVYQGMTVMDMAVRLTYLGASESLQGAVVSGPLGMGSSCHRPLNAFWLDICGRDYAIR